jgi:hypothetical protein
MAWFDFLNPLNAITDGIVKWQIAKENAKTDKDRIEAEVNIKALEAKRDVQVASTVHDKWYSPRSLIGYIVTGFLFKLFIWDTVLGLGVTAYPGSLIMEITTAVIAFYFVAEGLRGLIKR